MKDLTSRDYDVREIDEDARFVHARNEALFVQIYFTVSMILVILVCKLFGQGDPAQMKFFLIWPMWFVYGILTIIILATIGLIWLKFGYKDESLDAIVSYEDSKEVEQ